VLPLQVITLDYIALQHKYSEFCICFHSINPFTHFRAHSCKTKGRPNSFKSIVAGGNCLLNNISTAKNAIHSRRSCLSAEILFLLKTHFRIRSYMLLISNFFASMLSLYFLKTPLSSKVCGFKNFFSSKSLLSQ